MFLCNGFSFALVWVKGVLLNFPCSSNKDFAVSTKNFFSTLHSRCYLSNQPWCEIVNLCQASLWSPCNDTGSGCDSLGTRLVSFFLPRFSSLSEKASYTQASQLGLRSVLKIPWARVGRTERHRTALQPSAGDVHLLKTSFLILSLGSGLWQDFTQWLFLDSFNLCLSSFLW